MPSVGNNDLRSVDQTLRRQQCYSLRKRLYCMKTTDVEVVKRHVSERKHREHGYCVVSATVSLVADVP
jgi:hypothetical protein